MSNDYEKAFTDLNSTVSFGGGGGSQPTAHQRCSVIGATVGGTVSVVGDTVSKAPHPGAKLGGTVAKIAGPAIGGLTYAVCMRVS